MRCETLTLIIQSDTRTLDAVIAHSGEDLSLWWSRLAEIDAELAERAGGMQVLTDEEFLARGGRPAAHTAGGGPGWVWFRSAPSPSMVAAAIVWGVIGIGQPLAPGLQELLMRAVAHEDPKLVRTIRHAATAATRWTVADVEERLGMSLGTAYCDAGTRPRWGVLKVNPENTDLSTYIVCDADAFSREPLWFLFSCIEGLVWQDSWWEHFTERLFGEEERASE